MTLTQLTQTTEPDASHRFVGSVSSVAHIARSLSREGGGSRKPARSQTIVTGLSPCVHIQNVGSITERELWRRLGRLLVSR
jgi:hypothetical protein